VRHSACWTSDKHTKGRVEVSNDSRTLVAVHSRGWTSGRSACRRNAVARRWAAGVCSATQSPRLAANSRSAAPAECRSRPSPVGRPKICKQESITIPPEAGAKHAQDLAYGSEEWAKIYFRLRNSVEGTNGYAKDPVHEAIEAGATRRIRGIAPTSILLAFQLHHTNTRKLATWADTLEGANGEPPRRRPTRRRKSKPLGTWTPAGHLDTALQSA
jgi:hypothetical protein